MAANFPPPSAPAQAGRVYGGPQEKEAEASISSISASQDAVEAAVSGDRPQKRREKGKKREQSKEDEGSKEERRSKDDKKRSRNEAKLGEGSTSSKRQRKSRSPSVQFLEAPPRQPVPTVDLTNIDSDDDNDSEPALPADLPFPHSHGNSSPSPAPPTFGYTPARSGSSNASSGQAAEHAPSELPWQPSPTVVRSWIDQYTTRSRNGRIDVHAGLEWTLITSDNVLDIKAMKHQWLLRAIRDELYRLHGANVDIKWSFDGREVACLAGDTFTAVQDLLGMAGGYGEYAEAGACAQCSSGENGEYISHLAVKCVADREGDQECFPCRALGKKCGGVLRPEN